MLLMLRLGLRATEVATLRLEDIDWRAGLIMVRGKGSSRVDQLPLPVDVGEAITGYLQRGRPRPAVREVFVRAVAPRVALTRGHRSCRGSRQAQCDPCGEHEFA